jgi:hypothetical protein
LNGRPWELTQTQKLFALPDYEIWLPRYHADICAARTSEKGAGQRKA